MVKFSIEWFVRLDMFKLTYFTYKSFIDRKPNKCDLVDNIKSVKKDLSLIPTKHIFKKKWDTLSVIKG